MTQNKFKILDGSGDKKYFSIIPHYIVNHSSAYEQSLYLVMKRIAGEEGECFASPKIIGEIMKVSENTVKKYRKKLLDRGWIEKTGQRKSGKTSQLIDEYKIVDLWKLNIKLYSKVSPVDTLQDTPRLLPDYSPTDKVSPVDTLKVSPVDGKVSPVAYEEETMKKKQHSDFVAVRDYFVKRYEKEKNVKYEFSGGKDGSAIKLFLKRKNKPNYTALIDFYLKDDKSNRHPSISACLSADTINKFNLKNKPKYNEI